MLGHFGLLLRVAFGISFLCRKSCSTTRNAMVAKCFQDFLRMSISFEKSVTGGNAAFVVQKTYNN